MHSVFQASSRLKDAIAELTFVAESLSDLSNSRKLAIDTIMQSIVPLLHVAAQTLHGAGIVLSPFPGVLQLHIRNEKRKREVVDKSLNKRPALQMIDHFVENSDVEIPPIKEISMPDAPPATHVSSATKTKLSPVDLPPPKNGVTYTKSEALETVKMFSIRGNDRASALKAMSDKRFIPCSITYMHTLLQMDEKCKPITDENWSSYLFPPVEMNDNHAIAGTKQTSRKRAKKNNADQNEEIISEANKSKSQPESNPAQDPAKSVSRDLSYVCLPQPKNGNMYSKSEAITIINSYKEKPKERGKAVQAMIQRKLVPQGKASMYRLIHKIEQGVPISDKWTTKGRPRICSTEGSLSPNPPRPPTNIKLPKPKKGKIYSKTEAIKLCKKYKSKTPERTDAIATMISKGYVPSGPQFLHTLIKQDDKGLPIEDIYNWTKPLKPKPKPFVNAPEPRDGSIYSKSEFLEIIKTYKKGSRDRRAAIEAMLSKGYCPTSFSDVYRLIQRDEEGLPILDDDWGPRGRAPLISNDEIDSIVQKVKESDSMSFGMADVNHLLEEARKSMLVKRGEDPEAVDIASNRTCLNSYAAMFRSRLGTKYWKD